MAGLVDAYPDTTFDVSPSNSDFYRISDMDCRNYVKFVNSVLRRHKGQYLEEFKIVCDLPKRNHEDIDRWLVFALERKVQRLELNLLIEGYYPCVQEYIYVLPDWFHNFSCRSGFPQFDLKCLESLSLKCVEVTGEAINFILQECPVLERLELVASGKLAHLVISDPSLALKYLQIQKSYNLRLLSISNFNLVSLDILPVDDLTLTNIPMLVALSLSGHSNMVNRSLTQSSSWHSQLRTLTLEEYELKDVTPLSNFDQLTKLVIRVRAWGDESLTPLVSLVKSCPQLEEFVLKLRWIDPERSNRKRLGTSLSLKSKSLKVFEFVGYYGRVSDVELVMHVLEYAVSLEKIIIDPRNIQFFTSHACRESMEREARSIALQQFEDLQECIPQHVHLLIR